MYRKGKTVNDNCASGGEIVYVGYKQVQDHNHNQRYLKPEHEFLLFEYIEYAIAYRAIDKPKYKIPIMISSKSS